MPLPLVQRIRLISLSYEDSIQSVVSKLLTEWSSNDPLTNDEIINILASRAFKEWERRVAENQNSPLNKKVYLAEVINRLRKKKISSEHLTLTVAELDRLMLKEKEVSTCKEPKLKRS